MAKEAGRARSSPSPRSVEGQSIQVRWRSIKPSAPPVPILMLAVAKKLLPRAIDRNRFRRIAREAWRMRSQEDNSPATFSVFVRLMRRLPSWRELPDGQLKHAWRAELDELFARVPRR